MYAYSQNVEIPARQPMGGYSGVRISRTQSNSLEINGIGFFDPSTNTEIELCSLDALYPGDLVERLSCLDRKLILAASHTHFAPMLDSKKPKLGQISTPSVNAFESAIRTAVRHNANVNCCRVYRNSVSIPVYRRFDNPSTLYNSLLCRFGGMYPNESLAIDNSVYIFEFGCNNKAAFVILVHACHPVSRCDRDLISADYIERLRQSVRIRFGTVPCLFLQGCAGDIRPNIAMKRVHFLPRSRLNWKFKWNISRSEEVAIDDAYAESIQFARQWVKFSINDGSFQICNKSITLTDHSNIQVPVLKIANIIQFEFLPYEVSHLYHLNAKQSNPFRFIISCANDTMGYLPHPMQIASSGYEVHGSLACMGKLSPVTFLDSEI